MPRYSIVCMSVCILTLCVSSLLSLALEQFHAWMNVLQVNTAGTYRTPISHCPYNLCIIYIVCVCVVSSFMYLYVFVCICVKVGTQLLLYYLIHVVMSVQYRIGYSAARARLNDYRSSS